MISSAGGQKDAESKVVGHVVEAVTSSPSPSPAASMAEHPREEATERHSPHRHPRNDSGGGDGADQSRRSSGSGSYYSSSYDYESSDGTDGLESDGESVMEEQLLSFVSFPLDDALRGHHLMTMRAFRRILVIGTNQGTVAVVDPASGKCTALFHNHRDPIIEVDTTVNELYVAACDKAGAVSVQSRREKSDLWVTQMNFPMDCIALHPMYHKMEDRPMLCGGGGKVVLLTKSLFWSSSRHVKTLWEKAGRVHQLRWFKGSPTDVVAWLTDREVCIYDMREEAVVHRMRLPVDIASPVLYPPSLVWEPGATLICAWGDYIQEFSVSAASTHPPTSTTAVHHSTYPDSVADGGVTDVAAAAVAVQPATAFSSSLPSHGRSMETPALASHRIEVAVGPPLRTSATSFPYRVCGIAPYGPLHYVVVACVVDGAMEGTMQDLEMRVVERNTLADTYRGRLQVQHPHPLQLRLSFMDHPLPATGSSPPSSHQLLVSTSAVPLVSLQYFVLSADSVLRAFPSDVDDHVAYLIRIERYDAAYAYAAKHHLALRRHVLEDVGQRWLRQILSSGAPDSAAQVVEWLPRVLSPGNGAAWEQWIYLLDTKGESWRLVDQLPALPVSGDDEGKLSLSPPLAAELSQLRAEYYDIVLLRCLDHDPSLFYRALHRFQHLFTADVILKAVEKKYQAVYPLLVWGAKDGATEGCGDSVAGVGSLDIPTAERDSAVGSRVDQQAARRHSIAASYGFLLRQCGRYEEALHAALQLPPSPESDTELFSLIRSQQLFSTVLDLLPELLQKRPAPTLGLLMEHVVSAQADSHPGAERSPAGSPAPSNERKIPVSGAASHLASAPRSPLAVESVIQRLEASDRRQLWVYLSALQNHAPKAFATAAKQHAQLISTLLMDYDKGALVPFLKRMCMYMEHLRELHALCHKQGLLEAEVFLLFHMGREEEGLQVLVEKMHDMQRALDYILALPDEETQRSAFRSLVERVLAYTSSLPRRPNDGIRYLLYHPLPVETCEDIAARYHIDVAAFSAANGLTASTRNCASPSSAIGEAATSNSLFPPPPRPCVVPLSLVASLLEAIASPPFVHHAAISAALLLKRLPECESVPHAGYYIAAIASAKADEVSFSSLISAVGEMDLMAYYGQLLRRRTVGITLGGTTAAKGESRCCAFCHQPVTREMVVFACHHTYHSACVDQYMTPNLDDASSRLTGHTPWPTGPSKGPRRSLRPGTAPQRSLEDGAGILPLPRFCKACLQ